MCPKSIFLVAKMSSTARIIPKNLGKWNPELRIDSKKKNTLKSLKMTFGDSKMTSRELQNDLRRAQNEIRKLSRTPPEAPEDPQRSPKAALSQILHACV